MLRSFLSVLAFGLVVAGGAVPAFADSDTDFVVCAAVMPCNPDGTVQAPFDQGACADTYRSQCLSERVNQLEEDLNSCSEKFESRLDRTRVLRKKLREIRREMSGN